MRENTTAPVAVVQERAQHPLTLETRSFEQAQRRLVPGVHAREPGLCERPLGRHSSPTAASCPTPSLRSGRG
ncbi:hypothetical protein DVA67_007405 [Solirubrobacter sp. CPCC 204708]|nr:hypothetical protein [Solirubrobacter deserti]